MDVARLEAASFTQTRPNHALFLSPSPLSRAGNAIRIYEMDPWLLSLPGVVQGLAGASMTHFSRDEPLICMFG
jgi:hypothetical protein